MCTISLGDTAVKEMRIDGFLFIRQTHYYTDRLSDVLCGEILPHPLSCSISGTGEPFLFLSDLV